MHTNTRNLIAEQEEGIVRKKIFWPLLSVFYALFVFRNVLSFEFPISLYLVWIAVMALAFNDTETKALIISFIPLAPGFQSKYAVLVCMILLLLKYGKRLRVPAFVFLLPLLMLWELLHLDSTFSTVAEYLSGFAPLMCVAVVVSMPKKDEDVSFFSRVLAVSLAVGSVILLFNTVLASGQSIVSLVTQGFRLGAVEEAENYRIVYNANGLGYLCNIAIVGLLTSIYFKKAKKIDYFLLVFAAIIGSLTVSRTFLLCFAGTMVLFILLQEKSVIHKIKVFAAVAFILGLSLAVLSLVSPEIINNYVVRFNADDITGGRAGLFDFYNEFITSSSERLWYGIGIQSIKEKMWYFEGVDVNVPHNGYQQMIVGWGIIGLALMLLFLLCLIMHAKKKNPHTPFMCYLPLILLLTNIFGGQFVTSGTKLLSLVFIYLTICNGRKESNGTEKHK